MIYFKRFKLLIAYHNSEVKSMMIQLDLQHFCCGPKGCEIEVVYGEMIDAE